HNATLQVSVTTFIIPHTAERCLTSQSHILKFVIISKLSIVETLLPFHK
ncbi:unnamed protein product, partial [marine sediment metagenome]